MERPHGGGLWRSVGDSDFELEFAAFLDRCDDVQAYGKNYLAVGFKLDYVNATGDISNYYPDFLVRLTDGRVVIVELKGIAKRGQFVWKLRDPRRAEELRAPVNQPMPVWFKPF